MIGILTRDGRFYEYLVGVLAENGFSLCEPSRARLLIVDLDGEIPPKGKRARITVSSNIFEESDLLRPFLQSELIALCRERLGDLLDDRPPRSKDEQSDLFAFDGEALWVRGEHVILTPAENRLFSLLYTRRGETVPLADCEAVCRVRTARGNSVSVAVASLRKKLDYRLDQRLIVSVRGEGYRLLP